MTSAQAARQITAVPIVQERGMRCNLVITTAKAVSASTAKFMEQASLWTRYGDIASHMPGGAREDGAQKPPSATSGAGPSARDRSALPRSAARICRWRRRWRAWKGRTKRQGTLPFQMFAHRLHNRAHRPTAVQRISELGRKCGADDPA